ncbi:MAG: hypothetical protein JWP30_812 [Homoserinimonas sp.]|jgi:hypothetical protein|nr:hypothetical protein [Homoserinimonas sp.]
MSENRDESRATMRRAPKLPIFLIVGGGLGAVVTFILTGLFPVDRNVGFGALFGYFALYGIPLGIVFGAIVALILDRYSRGKAVDVMVELETVQGVPGAADAVAADTVAPEGVASAALEAPAHEPSTEARQASSDVNDTQANDSNSSHKRQDPESR